MVVTPATSENRMRLIGKPQMFPFFTAACFVAEREKSQKFRYSAEKYVIQIAATAISEVNDPGTPGTPASFVFSSKTACGISLLKANPPAFTHKPIARMSIIIQTAGPAQS